MKTNRSARSILKLRFTLLCFAVALLAVADLGLGESLVSRVGQNTTIRNDGSSASSVGISDLMAAAH